MSASRFSRRIAFGFGLGVAAACLAMPAIADTQVTFQAHNPWTQEVGTVDRYHASRDYTVQVGAGETFQVNLVTRDPNVFFKIRNDTTRDQLVDTYQTGATTWSTENPNPATYTIHVYVDPATMPRGEKAKYALQIGAYGAGDMQAATTEVSFQGDNPWAQEVGAVDAQSPAHDYTVSVAAGKTLQVNLVTRSPAAHFKVRDHSAAALVDTASTGSNTWSTPVTAASNYTIQVYVDPTQVPAGRQARYALQVGRFALPGQQPAAAASAAPATVPAMPPSAPDAAPAATTGG